MYFFNVLISHAVKRGFIFNSFANRERFLYLPASCHLVARELEEDVKKLGIDDHT